MSKLAEFRELERHLAQQMAALEAMKNDKGLEQEIEFESKLRALLGEYNKSLRDIIAILDPQAATRGARAAFSPASTSSRKPRTTKVYKNPHTGEVVQTKGGNHKTLKEWKAEYGQDEVESWLA
ncbi:hypothetical protein HDC30_002412 [Pseudomonas sp. JAI115]|uniref:histone-like nucleoid-structuring protein, MvaT/MvaU family n=1 Tax=Pseudomonas sp. JAI115 TaxID=2723061 RepID=UPI0016192401|nr:histone-like nucleoid-structuring protein, MvaT/MvaU family [Pseudomonas sp. JAI115]MBB6155189.1 hypothetical protein [Pseudomonas sp. JAI115]